MRAVGTGDIIAPGGRKGEYIDGGEAVRQSSVAGLYYKFSVMMSDSSSLNPPAAAMAINARPQKSWLWWEREHCRCVRHHSEATASAQPFVAAQGTLQHRVQPVLLGNEVRPLRGAVGHVLGQKEGDQTRTLAYKQRVGLDTVVGRGEHGRSRRAGGGSAHRVRDR